MGKLLQGILGGVSGKVGNVVGSSWKGIPVIKTKPLSVANPKTAAQVAQRGKFGNVVAFAQEVLSVVIKPLWDRFAQQQSGFNAFVSENITLFDSGLPSPASDLVISKGRMALTEMTSLDVSVGSTDVTLNWSDDSGEGFKLATDIPYFVVVDETREIIYAGDGESLGATRASGALTGTFPEAFLMGSVVHAYMAFKRADGTVVSNTSYKTVTL